MFIGESSTHSLMPSYGTIFLALRSAFVSEEDLGFEGALSARQRAEGGVASVEVEPRRCPLKRTAEGHTGAALLSHLQIPLSLYVYTACQVKPD